MSVPAAQDAPATTQDAATTTPQVPATQVAPPATTAAPDHLAPDLPVYSALPLPFDAHKHIAVAYAAPEAITVKYLVAAGDAACPAPDSAWSEVTGASGVLTYDIAVGLNHDAPYHLCAQALDAAGNAGVVFSHAWTHVAQPDFLPENVAKVSIAAPILTAGTVSGDDNGYLVGFNGYGSWATTSFVNGGNIVLSVPCKPGDSGGWKGCLATWTPGQATGAWLDANTGSATVSAYFTAGNELSKLFATRPDGSVVGVSGRNNEIVPFSVASFAAMSAVGMDGSHPNVFSLPTSLPFASASSISPYTLGRAGLYADADAIYLISNTSNGTSSFLAVSETTDLLSFTYPAAPILTGFDAPFLSKTARGYYLVAHALDGSGSWNVLHSPSITDWSGAQPLALDLERFAGAAGTWDETGFASTGGNPDIHGAWVIGDTLYLIYQAGFGAYTAATAPYGATRSFGVLKVAMDDDPALLGMARLALVAGPTATGRKLGPSERIQVVSATPKTATYSLVNRGRTSVAFGPSSFSQPAGFQLSAPATAVLNPGESLSFDVQFLATVDAPGGSLTVTPVGALTPSVTVGLDGFLVPTGGAFTPKQYDSLSLWLKADSLPGAFGSAVATWPDSGFFGLDAGQSAAGKQPVLKTAAVNSLNYVSFDGADDALAGGSSAWRQVFAVARAAASPTAHQSLWGQVDNDVSVRRLGSGPTYGHGNGNDFAPTASYYINGTQTNSVANNVWHVLTATAGATQSWAYSVGCAGGYCGSRNWKGDIAEIIAFSAPLSAADRQKVEGYLAHKYGLQAALPAGHPYLAAPP